MRVIKFRAWDKKELEMVDVHQLNWEDDGLTISFGSSWHCNSNDFEVMQFTGIYDKNKTEIYEGDRIKCEDLECVVEWNDFLLEWKFNSDGRSISIPPDYAKQFWEVTGNIYEPPELLGERYNQEKPLT